MPARGAGGPAHGAVVPDAGLPDPACGNADRRDLQPWGAVVAGCFSQLLPFLFQVQWGINPNFVLILFGAGLLQVLLTAPGGLVQQFPKDMANLGRLVWRGVGKLTGGGTQST